MRICCRKRASAMSTGRMQLTQCLAVLKLCIMCLLHSVWRKVCQALTKELANQSEAQLMRDVCTRYEGTDANMHRP